MAETNYRLLCAPSEQPVVLDHYTTTTTTVSLTHDRHQPLGRWTNKFNYIHTLCTHLIARGTCVVNDLLESIETRLTKVAREADNNYWSTC